MPSRAPSLWPVLFAAVVLCPGTALATKQFSPTVVRQQDDGTFKVDHEYVGGARLFIVDTQDQTRAVLWIKDAIPKAEFEFNGYVHRTTAGPEWADYALHYFVTIHDKPHFCVRTWWGRRVLIDLEGAKLVSADGFEHTLRSAEETTTTDLLRAGVTRMREKGIRCCSETFALLAAIRVAGQLKLENCIPLLQELEESDYVGSCGGSSFCVFDIRRIVQLSLRRLGVKPAAFPAMSIDPDQAHPEVLAEEKVRHATRVLSAGRIEKGMRPSSVLEHLGPPDYLDYLDEQGVTWRYDMDSSPSFSLLVTIEHQKVESVDKRSPALWNEPDLAPWNEPDRARASDSRYTLDADGTAIRVRAKVIPVSQPAQSAALQSGTPPARGAWPLWAAGGCLVVLAILMTWRSVR